MVISDAEKKILLERLQKAREVKAAKAAAAKKTPVSVPKKEAPPQPPPAPTIEPIPSPPVVESTARYVRLDESSVLKDEVQLRELRSPNPQYHLPPLDCVVDEVALPPKIKTHETREKREKFDNSSDESDNEKPVKKSSKTSKKVKQTPYMKIKIFHEPKNAHALQNLIEAVQDNDDEPIEYGQEPAPAQHQSTSASIEAPRLRHDIKNQTPKSSRTLPSHQELMRKAALEFFA